MRLLLFAIFIFSSAHASEKLYMLSDTYQKSLKEDIKLIWGDDAFMKKAGFGRHKIEEEKLPKLTAIMYDPEDPLAVVDGNPVGLGSKIGDREIVDIGKNYILLQKGNSVIEVFLGTTVKNSNTTQSATNSNNSFLGSLLDTSVNKNRAKEAVRSMK